MTYEELMRRVYAARHDLATKGGTNFTSWIIALHPWDLAHVTGELRLARYDSTVFGLRLRPDASLRIGEVRLRVEVAA